MVHRSINWPALFVRPSTDSAEQKKKKDSKEKKKKTKENGSYSVAPSSNCEEPTA